MTGLGLTTGDVITAIQAQNVQAAVGRIGARPVSDDQQLQLNIQTKGRLTSTEEFEKIIIRTNPDGSVLRLGDIARLRARRRQPRPVDAPQRRRGDADRHVSDPRRQSRSESVDALNKLLADNAKSFPDGLAWKVTYDPTAFVTETIQRCKKTLIEAFMLVCWWSICSSATPRDPDSDDRRSRSA